MNARVLVKNGSPLLSLSSPLNKHTETVPSRCFNITECFVPPLTAATLNNRRGTQIDSSCVQRAARARVIRLARGEKSILIFINQIGLRMKFNARRVFRFSTDLSPDVAQQDTRRGEARRGVASGEIRREKRDFAQEISIAVEIIRRSPTAASATRMLHFLHRQP